MEYKILRYFEIKNKNESWITLVELVTNLDGLKILNSKLSIMI